MYFQFKIDRLDIDDDIDIDQICRYEGERKRER